MATRSPYEGTITKIMQSETKQARGTIKTERFRCPSDEAVARRLADPSSRADGGPEHHGRFGDPPVPGGFAARSRAVHPASQYLRASQSATPFFIELQGQNDTLLPNRHCPDRDLGALTSRRSEAVPRWINLSPPLQSTRQRFDIGISSPG